ncbi:MAG TPA: hypothetical protein VF781_09230, partial [Solirubrobacteraceae bacterium]
MSAISRSSAQRAGPHAVRPVAAGPSTGARWATILVAGALALLLPSWHELSILVSDGYMTLYAGRFIAHHGIPHHEVFTLAARGRPWVDQQWLAQLIEYEAWGAGGYVGLGLLNALAIAGGYAGLAAICLRRGASAVMTLVGCLLAVVFSTTSMFIRAQDLTFPLFSALLAVCLTDSESEAPGWRIILTVPILVLWANLHGSVLLAAGLIALYLGYRAAIMSRRGNLSAARRYGLLALLAALAPLATPYGLHTISYYSDLIGNPAVARAATEDGPPRLGAPGTYVAFAALTLAAAVLLVCALRRQRVDRPLTALVLITAAATIFACRNVVWLSMASAVYLAVAAREWIDSQPPARGFVRIMSATAMVMVVLGAARLVAPPGGGYERDTPLRVIAAAARYADAHPQARILGDNTTASALLWHEPQLDGHVVYDARLERYSAQDIDAWVTYQL